MMKQLVLVFFLITTGFINAKEYKNLKAFNKETNKTTLALSDWLQSDRKNNTSVWQQANSYNLNTNLPEEYTTIKQRRDFYKWLHFTLTKKGNEVRWPAMAYYISKKIRLVNVFPYSIFTKKAIKKYSIQGSQTVFNQSFKRLKIIFNSDSALKGDQAIVWDQQMIYDEQYVWIQGIYDTMDSNSLKTLSNMAKGHFLYSLVVPKQIRFKGNLSIAEERYQYALEVVRSYNKLIKE